VLFARDEVISWLIQRNQTFAIDKDFRQSVHTNIGGVLKRLDTLACKHEREEVRRPAQPL
jgi:transformation/transcription domain-associated protein